jgi:hypothetical protein
MNKIHQLQRPDLVGVDQELIDVVIVKPIDGLTPERLHFNTSICTFRPEGAELGHKGTHDRMRTRAHL